MVSLAAVESALVAADSVEVSVIAESVVQGDSEQAPVGVAERYHPVAVPLVAIPLAAVHACQPVFVAVQEQPR